MDGIIKTVTIWRRGLRVISKWSVWWTKTITAVEGP